MKIVSFDTECHVIQPGLVVPPLVCGVACEAPTSSPPENHAGVAALPVEYFTADECAAYLERVLEGPDLITGGNLPFDFAVVHQHALARGRDLMPLIWSKYERGEVHDIQISETLHAIGAGHLLLDGVTFKKLPAHYSVDECVRQRLGRRDAKDRDVWQLRFHELERLPLRLYPAEARKYMADDARNPMEVALAQLGCVPGRFRHQWQVSAAGSTCASCGEVFRDEGAAPSPHCLVRREVMNLHDVPEQCEAAWALHLSGAHGFARDERAIAMIAAAYAARHREEDEAPFRRAGFLRPDGSVDTGVLKRRIALAYMGDDADPCPHCAGTGKVPKASWRPRLLKSGKVSRARVPVVNCEPCDATGLLLDETVPRAPAEGVKRDRDALFESGDELLTSWAEWSEENKIPTGYLPFLRQDGGGPLTTKFNPVVGTGRVSAAGLILTFPRRPGRWVEVPE